MSDEEDTGVAGKVTAGNSTVTTLRGKQKQTADRAAKGAIAAERSRITEIQDLFAGLNERFQGDETDDLRNQCITDGLSIDRARVLAFDLINSQVGEQTVSVSRKADSQNGSSRAEERSSPETLVPTSSPRNPSSTTHRSSSTTAASVSWSGTVPSPIRRSG